MVAYQGNTLFLTYKFTKFIKMAEHQPAGIPLTYPSPILWPLTRNEYSTVSKISQK